MTEPVQPTPTSIPRPAIVRPAASLPLDSSPLDEVVWTARGPLLREQHSLFKSVTPQPVVEPAPERISETPSSFVQRTHANDQLRLKDGFDASRDLVSVEAAEGRPEDPYVLRVTLDNLRPGAEKGNLDVYWLVGTGGAERTTKLPDRLPGETSTPWNIAVAAYDNGNALVQHPRGSIYETGVVKWTRFDRLTRVVEVGLDKTALRAAGWSDGAPVTLQALTSKDYSGLVTDSIDLPAAKPWSNQGRLTAAADTAKGPTPLQARSQDWQGESIYFAFTDRFKDGDPANNHGVDPGDLRRYQGGDLRGVIEKLDYIKDLGMTTIWVSPPFAQQTRKNDYEGFHGYWPVDHYRVDARQGDLDTFKELVDRAHERGMKVLLDLPVNHTAWDHPWASDPARHSWFHHNGEVKDWEDPHQVENFDVLGLPDLAQENPEVERALVDVAKWWIDNTKIDGFRLDAVKHVGHPFWERFAREVHAHAGPDFLLLGEDLHGAVPHVSRYQNEGLEGMLDFPLYYSIRDTIAQGAPMKHLADRLAEELHGFDNPRKLGVFLDNHDLNRFMHDAGADGRRKLMLALAFAFTIDRIPTMYMGTEVGMTGSEETHSPTKSPDNRKMMEWDKDPELAAYFSRLGQLRQSREAFREGGYLELWKDDQVVAFERVARTDNAVVILNGSDQPQARAIPAHVAGRCKDGMRLVDALSGREVTVADGRISVEVPARGALLLVPGEGS